MNYMTAVAERNNTSTRKNMSARKLTILLVDDESAITLLFEVELTRIGYYVLTASSPQEARQIATDFPSTIDVLITDWHMPGMTGDQLACDLLVQRPSLKVVLMSGYPEAATVCQAFDQDQLAFLSKPFSVDELNGAIKRLLGPSSEPDRQVA
jgi:two-component system cell cycle sensor histidine kinase/response regulator CckA